MCGCSEYRKKETMNIGEWNKTQKQVFILGKEIKPKELKGRHLEMVILNDLDDMLSEIVLEKKIANIKGEK